MRVFYAPYELKPASSLSSRAQTHVRAGALLKIEHPGFGFGYADLHPWPELGDEPLLSQLRLLQNGTRSPLLGNSIEMTRIDAKARARGVSLWESLEIPASHSLVSEIGTLFDGSSLSRLFSEGFDRIKIKLGRDPENEARLLNALCARLGERAKVRLDFNASLSMANWEAFIQSLSEAAIRSIEFVEDPIDWQTGSESFPPARGLSLALDRDAETVSRLIDPIHYSHLVIKPAVSSVATLLERAQTLKKRIVFTSYLDHPIGQLWAAWFAASAARFVSVETCGLLSQDAYESHPASEWITSQGPRMTAPSAVGIFEAEALEKTYEWKELK